MIMGTVHKFKRPPKNKRQFKGYRPMSPSDHGDSASVGWQLRPWQRSLLAWLAIALFASGLWLVGRDLGG